MHNKNACWVLTHYHLTSYKTLNTFRKEHNKFSLSEKFYYISVNWKTNNHKVLRQASGYVGKMSQLYKNDTSQSRSLVLSLRLRLMKAQ